MKKETEKQTNSEREREREMRACLRESEEGTGRVGGKRRDEREEVLIKKSEKSSRIYPCRFNSVF